jgi:hypothetical protein
VTLNATKTVNVTKADNATKFKLADDFVKEFSQANTTANITVNKTLAAEK